MNEKGQLSADFIFATLILLIVISSIVGIVSSGIDTANNAGLAEAKAIGERVAGAINTVYTNGNGHFVTVNLTSDANFNLTVNNATVAVRFNNKTTISNLIPDSGSVNSIIMGPNETYRIVNNNGLVTFTKLG